MQCNNEFGKPIGTSISDWESRLLPQPITLTGRTCQLKPSNTDKHADDLYTAFSHDDGRPWTYMVIGPFASAGDFAEILKYAEVVTEATNLHTYVVIDPHSGKAVGMLSLMRVNPLQGVIEVGRIVLSSLLQRSTLSTEAQYLILTYVFDHLGYRRCEWRSNSRFHF